jgi:hypothetical protein
MDVLDKKTVRFGQQALYGGRIPAQGREHPLLQRSLTWPPRPRKTETATGVLASWWRRRALAEQAFEPTGVDLGGCGDVGMRGQESFHLLGRLYVS